MRGAVAVAARGLRLNLGCGPRRLPGYVNVDREDHDLRQFPWPWPDGSASEVLMEHVLEHLPDTLATAEEVLRVLEPGGRWAGAVPYAFSESAVNEPDHVRYLTDTSVRRIAEMVGFEVVSVRLATFDDVSRLYRLRSLIPFRGLLRHMLINMYDEVRFELRKPNRPARRLVYVR